MTDPYYVLKLRTGETLFAEIVGEENGYMSVINPWLVSHSADHADSFSLTEWMPFVDQTVFDIESRMCFFKGKMSKKFIRFYGSVILQLAISKIKEDVVDTMEDRNDYHVMVEGVKRMKEITEELTEKFDLDVGLVDFSTFDDKVNTYKPILH